jgi:hypothetical protein
LARKQRPDPPPAAPRRRRLSGAERDEAIRAQLEPYAPGERPAPIRIAVGVSVVLALINLGLMISGAKLHTKNGGGEGGTIAFAAVMLTAAAGMWQMRYWAVLGFQALLGISVVLAALAMIIASNLEAFALCITVIGLCGTLFWKLVRVLSRMQAPARPID